MLFKSALLLTAGVVCARASDASPSSDIRSGDEILDDWVMVSTIGVATSVGGARTWGQFLKDTKKHLQKMSITNQNHTLSPLKQKYLFKPDGTPSVDQQTALNMIKHGRLSHDMIRQVWPRLLSIRQWDMTDGDFRDLQAVMNGEYEALSALSQNVPLDNQILKDIKRSGLKNQHVLRDFFKVFIYKHAGLQYIQGYSQLAEVCVMIWGEASGSLGVALAVFQAMMDRLWRDTFEDMESFTTTCTRRIMSTIKCENVALYTKLKTGLGMEEDDDMSAFMAQPLLLWGRPAFVRTEGEDIDDIVELVSFWMNCLTVDDPMSLLCMFYAGLLLTEGDRFCGDDAMQCMQALTGGSPVRVFRVQEACEKAVRLHDKIEQQQ